MNDRARALQDLLAERRSSRDFTGEAVSEADVEALLAAARPDPGTGWPHPSAHDLRPVSVDLVRPDSSRAAIEAAAFDDQPWLVDAPVLLVVTADLSGVSAEFAEQDPDGLRGRDFAFIEAGAAAQSVLLTATSLGLGSVLVAGVRQREMRAALGTERHVVAIIAVGHTGPGFVARSVPDRGTT